MNNISTNQNKKENLAKRVACKEVYACAKNAIYVELLLALFIGVMYIIYAFSDPIFSFLHSNFNQWNLFPFIAPLLSVIFTLMDNCFITTFIKSKVEQAAYIQEDFDRNVFELPANKIVVNSFEYVSYVMDEKRLNDFKNWYDVKVSQIPIEFGRIIAQKSNCIWELNIRNDFTKVLGIVIFILIIVMITVEIHAYDLKSIVISFISLIYLLNLFINYYKASKSSKNRISLLNKNIDKIWAEIMTTKSTDDLTDISKDIQTQLYHHRKNVALVPDAFYRLKKDEHQDKTGIFVEKMIDEYKINF